MLSENVKKIWNNKPSVGELQAFSHVLPALLGLSRQQTHKNRQSMTACSLPRMLLLKSTLFNHAGPQDVTKQHFCKILWRKLCLRGIL